MKACENCTYWNIKTKDTLIACYCDKLNDSSTKKFGKSANFYTVADFWCKYFKEIPKPTCQECKRRMLVMDGDKPVGLLCKGSLSMYGPVAGWFVSHAVHSLDDEACGEFERLDNE